METSTRMKLRWLSLALCCGCQYGLFYVYSAPAAIQNQIESAYDLSAVQYNLFFSIYNFPSILVPTFAGILCDKYNTGICMAVFCLLLNIGQTLFCLGFHFYSYQLMLVGRFLLGLAGESLVTSVAVILGVYFVNKEQSFSYSLCTTISRLFAVISYPITLTVYTHTEQCISCSLWIGEYIMLFALVCAVFIAYIDYYHFDDGSHIEKHRETIKTNANFMRHIQNNMNICFVLLLFLCVLQYACIYPWLAIGSSFMQITYVYSRALATTYLMIPQGIAALFTPLIGILVDCIGHRCELLIVSALLLIFGHGLFLMHCVDIDENLNEKTGKQAVYALSALGVSFSIFAPIVFLAVNIVLPHSLKGFGMGLMSSVLAFGCTVFPLLVGELTGDSGDDIYRKPQLLFFAASCVSLVIAVGLKWIDYRNGNRLKRKRVIKWKQKTVSYGSVDIV